LVKFVAVLTEKVRKMFTGRCITITIFGLCIM